MKLWVLPLVAGLAACGGAPSSSTATATVDDPPPALDDPATREEALAELEAELARTLSAAHGDRSAPAFRALVDARIGTATRVCVETSPGPFRGRLLEYLIQLRDPRTLVALLAALDDPSLSMVAARALAHLELPADLAPQASRALATRLSAGGDEASSLAVIAALVTLGDPAATVTLGEVAVGADSPHTHHVRRVAMEALGTFRDPSSTPAAIRGLFVFVDGDPTQRLDDAAVRTLARIGEPAVAPLIRVLEDEDPDARALASDYVEAVHAHSPDTEIDVDQVLVEQASAALGAIGDPSAFEALRAVARLPDDPTRSMPALAALADLDLDDARSAQVRALLESAYPAAPLEAKAQLLSLMRARIDPASLPFLIRVARSRRADELLRVLAFHAAANIALGSEARPLKAIRLPDRSATLSREPVIELAVRCAEDVECWLAEAGSEHVDLLEKVAYALGRLGTGDPRAHASLRALLAHPDVRVRLAALNGLDRAGGAGEVVETIEGIRAREEGQASWARFATAAMPAAASFEARQARRDAVSEAPPPAEAAAAPKGGAPDRRLRRARDRFRR